MVANRTENRITSDCVLISSIRKNYHRFEAAHAELLKTWRTALASDPAKSRAVKYIRARLSLLEIAACNFQAGTKAPEDFSTQLYANDLTPTERELLLKAQHVRLLGAQQIRIFVGHCPKVAQAQ